MFDDEASWTLVSGFVENCRVTDILFDRVVSVNADGVNLDFEFVPASNGESPFKEKLRNVRGRSQGGAQFG